LLGRSFGDFWTVGNLQNLIEYGKEQFPEFVKQYRGLFSTEQLFVLQRVCEQWPDFRVHNLLNQKRITLVHRDTFTSNFLFPLDPTRDTIKIIDWQGWRMDTGTDDLAYMMALHWSSELRSQWEVQLVHNYCDELLLGGVQNYTWEHCWADYRASILRCLFVMVAGWKDRNVSKWWLPRVRSGLQAVIDLNCLDLLS
jgi:thiamine kinase-like enzyme